MGNSNAKSNIITNQPLQDITQDVLAIDWTLTAEDIDVISENCRGSLNRLRFAAQLCYVRNTGRFLENYHQLAIKIIEYLARQLECDVVISIPQPERSATDYNYRDKITEHLCFSIFDKGIENEFNCWITAQLMLKIDCRDSLLKRSEAFLLSRKILLPSTIALGRKIASIRRQHQQEIYEKIKNKIEESTIKKLNQLLETSKYKTLSDLQAYKRSPPEPTAQVINLYLERLARLDDIGITKVNLSDINPDIVREFYQLTSNYNVRDLKRMSPESKRYALLICFLVESYKILLDQIVQLNDKMLAKKERISRNKYDRTVKVMRNRARAADKVMIPVLEKLLGYPTPQDSIAQFHKQINSKSLAQAIANRKELIQYEENGFLIELSARYRDLRKYTGRFIELLDFKAAQGSESLLEAVNILRQLNNGRLSTLPDNVPCNFVPIHWYKTLKDSGGKIDRRTWELALYYAVNESLGSGDLYLEYSGCNRNFWETVYSSQDWEQTRDSAYAGLKLPSSFDKLLTKLSKEFNKSVKMARANVNDNSFAYISNGELKLRRDDALEIPESTEKLRQIIESRLPLIRIEKLLAEIDAKINFSALLVPPAEYAAKTRTDININHATLLAHATNIGLYGMAHSVENISVDELRHASKWLLCLDTLTAINTLVVNEHRKLPLSSVYGDGIISGSDGQRYGIRASSIWASYYPRYYGYYDKAITIYTHISDNYSVFSTFVISCGVREATYVLSGLLMNETELSPTFHSTDTHGFTHHVFALCYLLGFSFQPRLKDLAAQTLYALDGNANYGKIKAILAGVIDVNLIREQWDQLVRIAAALKNRLAPAHVIVEKLANRINKDKAAAALVELGKLIKTIFILRYISDSKLRHAIYLQLNRGEFRHALAQHIFFANQGIFKTGDYTEIMNKASCLSFISNIILYWNSLQIEKIISDLSKEGYYVDNQDLARIAPLMHKHIIAHGMYNFKQGETNV